MTRATSLCLATVFTIGCTGASSSPHASTVHVDAGGAVVSAAPAQSAEASPHPAPAAARTPPSDVLDCAAVCAARASQAPHGFCSAIVVGGSVGQTTCTAACASRGPGLSPTERAAFEACMTRDPLCYRSLDDCMQRPPKP